MTNEKDGNHKRGYSLEEIKKMKSRSNAKEAQDLTDEEIRRGIEEDPDTRELSDEELKEPKPHHKRDKKHDC